MPKMAQCGDVHVLALSPMPERTEHLWGPHVTGRTDAFDRVEGDQLVDLIVSHAKEVNADAVFALSEYAVLAVAYAAERLGLVGAGPNVAKSRDKRLMREVWEHAGVPSPRFRRVASEDELRAAVDELTLPVLLKSALGAGSIGQLVIEHADEVADAWAQASAAVASAVQVGIGELHDRRPERHFLVEEIIKGSIRTWFDEDSGYGDYLSVEGIVARGVYHPIAITTRIPTIPPFTELSNLAPCSLPEPLQRKVEAVAKAAVDALGLDTCGTHTELKLADNGEVFLIESAARLGGVMVIKEIENVFGYDMVGMLLREMLGEQVDYPERMLLSGSAAAGSLSIIATDDAGTPWQRLPVWDFDAVDWSAILSEGSSIEAVAGLSIPNGTPMPKYDVAGGSTNYAGIFFLQARDAETLVRDSHSVLNNLEAALTDNSE
ncbi:ATP-grasp domain-containing protein [Actinokineospora sp.]|uniref:ATP-grasp domain-containing protein n=1 Tax=Actinokineospora sp. TaxID=1872133 RepID=UPI003D6A6960